MGGKELKLTLLMVPGAVLSAVGQLETVPDAEPMQNSFKLHLCYTSIYLLQHYNSY